MKLFRNAATSVRLQIIGYIVFYTCWIIPVILSDGLSLQGDLGLAVLLTQLGVGGFLILLGAVAQKREADDPNYEIPRNFFRVFRAWQLLLMAALVLFFGSVFGRQIGWWRFVCSFGMFGCLIAAAVVGIIQRKKGKTNHVSVGGGKMIKTTGAVVTPIRCGGCFKLVNPDDLRIFDGKRYCSACYMSAFDKKQQEEQKHAQKLQTHCCICKRAFPQSSFHLIEDKFVCDECFQKEFSVTI